MKTKVASLLAVILITTTQCISQNRVTVQAENDDISNNLDLQAVASIFGEAKDLEEFEMKLNDYDSRISNLDLNNDGEVDYLRVIETSENGAHLVLIQAVLGKEIFQDVASIVIEKKQANRTYVQVIGNPYIYGENYIVEPVYVYTPSIFSFFWGTGYRTWISPYYWGYYPRHYRVHNPFHMDVYLTHIHNHINHNHHYYYSNKTRYNNYDRVYRSVSRNDYSTRYPERRFSTRNEHARNKSDIQVIRRDNNNSSRPQYRNNESTRSSENYDGKGSRTNMQIGTPIRNNERNQSRNVEDNSRKSDANVGSRSSGTVTHESNTRTTPPVIRPRNNSETRSTESSRKPENNTNSRSSSTVTRESSTRSTPVVTQPTKSTETRSTEKRPSESPRRSESESTRGTKSTESRSGRR